ncbi:hypothetical protein F2P81_001853 [Scophthalmus maximus]|uniref:Uncharacterized protein n=1 Tax=Scophthalmus maximus TaxID=52904 RepID=A0A6A4TQ31_SCOMX|nr:hypothetical protein F2P81_001853 [Scophthalmus maximus]
MMRTSNSRNKLTAYGSGNTDNNAMQPKDLQTRHSNGLVCFEAVPIKLTLLSMDVALFGLISLSILYVSVMKSLQIDR